MDEFMENFDQKTKVLCGACTAFSLLVTVLIAAGFGIVEPTEYGIRYNYISQSIN
jgi:hypothetical protein